MAIALSVTYHFYFKIIYSTCPLFHVAFWYCYSLYGICFLTSFFCFFLPYFSFFINSYQKSQLIFPPLFVKSHGLNLSSICTRPDTLSPKLKVRIWPPLSQADVAPTCSLNGPFDLFYFCKVNVTWLHCWSSAFYFILFYFLFGNFGYRLLQTSGPVLKRFLCKVFFLCRQKTK